MASMQNVSTSTKIWAEPASSRMPFAGISSSSVLSTTSYTTTRSIQLKDMSSMQNISTSTKIGADISLRNKLKNAVDDCCLRIQEQVKLVLSSIEPDVIRLLLDDKFKNRFLLKANNR